MADSPAFQFYPADYLADLGVQVLTSAQEGIYIRLLCYCWREGSLPSDAAVVRRMCKPDAKLRDVQEVMTQFFKAGSDAGRLINNRLEKERRKQAIRRQQASEAGKKSAEDRKRKGNETPTDVERSLDSGCDSVATESNPSSSSSSLSSSSASAVKPKRGQSTWLTPYDETWKLVFGGSMPFAKFSKELKSLEDIHGPAEVQDRWSRYCESHRGRGEFASAQKFAQTFGQWQEGGNGTSLFDTLKSYSSGRDE
jgi:uncharacterized protein YdaU (DUF1376 family)